MRGTLLAPINNVTEQAAPENPVRPRTAVRKGLTIRRPCLICVHSGKESLYLAASCLLCAPARKVVCQSKSFNIAPMQTAVDTVYAPFKPLEHADEPSCRIIRSSNRALLTAIRIEECSESNNHVCCYQQSAFEVVSLPIQYQEVNLR